jgi:DNA-directed RNA polymerase specialized sigma24 family protein
MKTTAIHNKAISSIHPQNDARRLDDFDDLVALATQGDRRAIGAIAIAMSPTLLEEARGLMGEFEDEAGDVLQDFFVWMLEGRTRFTPARGRALPWMCGIIRAMARRRRAQCEKRWGIAGDP